MRKYGLFFVAMCLCSACVFGGCSDDNGKSVGPTPPPEDEIKDAYTFDGVKTELKSMFCEKIGNYIYVFLSSDKVERYDELLETDNRDEFVHPFIELLIDPALIGKKVDVVTETEYFAFYNMTSSRGEFESVESGATKGVKSGLFTIKTDADKRTASVKFRFTLSSGKVFEGNYTRDSKASVDSDIPDAGSDTYQADGQCFSS